MTATDVQRRAVYRGIRSPEMRAVVRACVKNGWTMMIDGGQHIRLTSPTGRTVTVSTTAHGGRALHNVKAAVKRAGGNGS